MARTSNAVSKVVEPTGQDVPKSLTDLLGFHIRMAHSAMYRDFASTMEPLDLTQRQLAVLHILAGSPGISQIDIAGMLVMDRPTVMAIVDRLQDRRLLKRKRSATDGRRQELHLTEAGQDLLDQAKRAVAVHEARFTSRFTAKELDNLLDALQRIHG
jgi:DNA-binding MarR family transcriptional regulator